MWTFLVKHYRLKPMRDRGARGRRRGSTRGRCWSKPQKWGKARSSAMICAEAVGDVVFAGWDANGEPVGRPWPTPIIQVTASTEDQTDNVYKALRPMIDNGPLADIIPDTGETRINLPGQGWMEPVTSKASVSAGRAHHVRPAG
jgi:hypothetical protein